MKSIKGGFIMNEHEIFNSDEDDVLVETKQTKKECKCSFGQIYFPLKCYLYSFQF